MATIEIVTTPAEKRQIARTLNFDASLAPYINWDSIATQARELGAHFEVRYEQHGACSITFFWSYTEDELR